MSGRGYLIGRAWSLILVAAAVTPAAGAVTPPAGAPDAAADTSFAMPADGEGAVFGSLTVEGENRVRIRFARPDLALDLDPSAAPGLVIDGPLDILDRTRPDPVGPLLAASAPARSPFTGRPWLQGFTGGPVARFRSTLSDVARWELQVVDSRGAVAMVFAGSGAPPAEIAWDGRRLDGRPAPCGLTYSFVMEAYDRAGNKRRIVGDGFDLPPYRLDGDGGPALVSAGSHWSAAAPRDARDLALEAASRLNLGTAPDANLALTVQARSLQAAEELGGRVLALLQPLLAGPARRLTVVTEVSAEAPEAGALLLAPAAAR